MEADVKALKDVHMVLKNGFREVKRSLDGIEKALLRGENGSFSGVLESGEGEIEASEAESAVDFVQGVAVEEDKLAAGWHILDSSGESYPDENEGWVFAKIANKEGKILDIPCMMRYDYEENQWKLPKYLNMVGPDYYVVGWKRIKY